MKFSEAQKVQLVMALTGCDHETGLHYLRAANGITMDAVDAYRLHLAYRKDQNV